MDYRYRTVKVPLSDEQLVYLKRVAKDNKVTIGQLLIMVFDDHMRFRLAEHQRQTDKFQSNIVFGVWS